jgi:hypothetical protein
VLLEQKDGPPVPYQTLSIARVLFITPVLSSRASFLLFTLFFLPPSASPDGQRRDFYAIRGCSSSYDN